MTRPTAEEHVLQKARVWRRTERALTGARGGPGQAQAAKAHTTARRKLREAVDMLEQKDSAAS